jgi:dienelactone hydrolase
MLSLPMIFFRACRPLLALLIVVGGHEAVRAETNPDGGEFVHFSSAGLDPGQQLRGLLFRPEGAGPFPAVVAMHGCSGLIQSKGKMFERDAGWAHELRNRGFITLFVDSFGSRGVAAGCAAGSDPVAKPWAERTYDSYAGLAYLQGRADVIADRVGLIGWSHGGATVMFTVSTQGKARPSHLPHGDFRAAVAFYPGWCRAGWMPANWAPAMPLLVVLGGADNWTVAAPCAAITQAAAKAGAPVETVIYPGAFHDFDGTNPLRAITLFEGSTSKIVMVGTNPEARVAVYKRVPEYFALHLTTGPIQH